MAISRINRLDRESIKKTFKAGKHLRGEEVSLRIRKNYLEQSRFAIVIPSRVIKKAATRNKIKRIIADFLKKNSKLVYFSHDIVISVNKKIEGSSKGVTTILERNFKKCGLV